MALFIRGEAVDDLVDKVMQVTNAKTKTEAVRRALQLQLKTINQTRPLLERIRDIQSQADAIGPVDPRFNMKTFSDDMHEV